MRTMRKSTGYFAFLAVLLAAFAAMFPHARYRQSEEALSIASKARMVRELGLTDLCLFTEASYTRHLSLSDFHTAFQNSPMALEHFPSGSLVTHPHAAKKTYENVD